MASAAYARDHDSARAAEATPTSSSQRLPPKPPKTNTRGALRERLAAFFRHRSATLPADETPIHDDSQPAPPPPPLHPNHPFLNSRLFLHLVNSTDFLPAYRSTVTLHTAHYPPIYQRNENLMAMLRRKRPRKAGKKMKNVLKAVGRGFGEACLVLGSGLTGHAAGTAPGWGTM
ncbi:hypothetical protein HDU87_002191 [Geranomyces variabilis]|uniref:Uncharacterized protein n=1 Tax=Geranomyces variabilis TaxID=109894 RepID=A0AAD5TP01_9FUNG|nr:hypothetical protein HDU87_002191 [Geranomyces variabilis]